MEVLDAEVLATLHDDMFRPAVVEEAVRLALEELSPGQSDKTRAKLGGNAGLFKVDGSERLKALLRHPAADREMGEITVADVANRVKAMRR